MPYPHLDPRPCSSPLLTHTSTADAQTQFYLSLCGVLRTWCTQCLFEPSRSLWREWDLILNVNLPLLPSCWGFAFALGCGIISSQPLQHLPSYWGFSDLRRGVSPHGRKDWSLKGLITDYCSLEGLMLKLKLRYFGHLMRRTDSFEKTLMLGKTEGGRRRGWQEDEMVGWYHWLNGEEFG